MTSGKYIGLLLLPVLLSACEGHCPGYQPPPYYSVLYSLGDTMVFTDQTDTIRLVVEEFYQTPRTTFKSFLGERFCDGNESRFQTNTDPRFGYRIFEKDGTETFESTPFTTTKITPTDSFIYDAYHGTSVPDEGTQVVLHDKITIDSIEYLNVFDLQLDTIAQSDIQVFRLLRNKDSGIIQFYDRLNSKTWTLAR